MRGIPSMPDGQPNISNSLDEETKKVKVLCRLGAGIAAFFLIIVVIAFRIHGLH
jgi:hypothetical protein